MKASKGAITHMNWQVIDPEVTALSVRKLQNRIVEAKKANRMRMVRKLQKLLVKSLSGRELAVKRVSENKGKNTPGVDGKLLNTPKRKRECVKQLSIPPSEYKSMPLRRIEIPKKNGKTRPLGIPTVFDRSMQALYKLALEPLAEMQADDHSYGFRPKRSAQDAMIRVWAAGAGRHYRKWVLEADIKGCFDNISHTWLEDNIPLPKPLLRQWLKSGFVFDKKLYATTSGTPQGGIISPILANMVLDGLEDIVRSYVSDQVVTRDDGIKEKVSERFYFIRYADDFVVTGESPERLTQIMQEMEIFLAKRGLEFSKVKTKITNIHDGFDFLGFNFRKYPNGKMIVKPSKENIQRLKHEVRKIFKRHRGSHLSVLIKSLNPVLRGWGNYFRFANASKTFSTIDQYVWQKSMRWVKRRHQHRRIMHYIERYFSRVPGYQYQVLNYESYQTVVLKTIHIRRFPLIKSEANVFDRECDEYFKRRFLVLKSLSKASLGVSA